MNTTFPGSIVQRKGKSAAEFLQGLFFATKGIMLVQVREITGLDTPLLQNWVGRGWVPKPVEKRYSANHLARIMLINMMRPAAKLENIDRILNFINGDSEGKEAIIPEAELYIYICDILDNVDFETVLTDSVLDPIINDKLACYKESFPEFKEKLALGIKLIILYYASALVKVRADRILRSLGIAKEEE